MGPFNEFALDPRWAVGCRTCAQTDACPRKGTLCVAPGSSVSGFFEPFPGTATSAESSLLIRKVME